MGGVVTRPADYYRSMVGSCICGQQWFSIFAAHCSSCHRTFGTVESYEAAHVDGCCEPESVGLKFAEHYWWLQADVPGRRPHRPVSGVQPDLFGDER